MGTATPKTGQIAFSDLNTGILQAGSTTSLNMNTAAQRMGYSLTGEVSISLLRGCIGFATAFTFYPASKYVPAYYAAEPNLTYSPAGDKIVSVVGSSGFGYDGAGLSGGSPGSDPSIGWRGTSATRIVVNDSSRTLSPAATNTAVYGTPSILDSTASRGIGLKFV